MRSIATLALALAVALSPARAKEDRDPSPVMSGPIADFWNQVKREWARKIPGLRSGPDQTAQWVSLVYGTEGEDEALADLLEREMRQWAKWQRRNWVRSEFWRKSYQDLDQDGFYGSRALRQNLVVIGTPGSNPMVSEMTEGTPFRIEDDRIRVGDRDYEGRSLVLAFLRPNPWNGTSYALVLAATRDQALLDLGRMPMGPTDYVLFRGGHAVDRGFLDWSVPDDLVIGDRRELRPDHEGWWATAEGPLNVLFDPQEVPEEEARAFARRRAAGLPDLAVRFGIPEVPPLDLFLYGTVDSKLRQTGEPGPMGVDLPGAAVHRVHRPDLDAAAWPEAMLLAWEAWGPTDLRGLLLGIALLADGEIEGRSLDEWAARLVAAGRLPPVEDLFVPGPPWNEGSEERALQAVALGSFLGQLQRDHGAAALERLVREARSGNFRARFREILGVSIGRADRAWRDGLAPPEPPPQEGDEGSAITAAGTAPPILAEGRALFEERRDAEAAARLREALRIEPSLAEAHLLLGRLAFRGGRDDEALHEAAQALRLAPGDPEVAAWARVTLGRAHATRGEIQSARLELTDPALDQGPEAPRLLADLWLENLGLSPNRAAASAYLAEQAEIDLLSFDWDEAERRALQILSADPGDAGAHHLLARIRLEKFSYWYDFISFYNELFPNTTPSNPLQYYYLVQSSHRESLKGSYLASGERGTLELDRSRSRQLEPEWVPDRLYPAMREPAAISDSSREVLRGRAFLLAGDYDRAAAHLRAALQLTIPVSDARAWALLLLAQAEIRLGEMAPAQAHLDEAQKIARKRSLVAEIEAARALLPGDP